MDDRGFVKLAQTFIDIVAKNGNVDINSILYDIPFQSKTNLPKYFKRKRETLPQCMISVPTLNECILQERHLAINFMISI